MSSEPKHFHLHLAPVSQDAQLNRIEKKLDKLTAVADFGLQQVLRQETTQLADLTALTAKVKEQATVTASAVILLDSLAELLRAAAMNPSEIHALANSIDQNNAALAKAVSTNTPVEPRVVSPPEPAADPFLQAGPQPTADEPVAAADVFAELFGEDVDSFMLSDEEKDGGF